MQHFYKRHIAFLFVLSGLLLPFFTSAQETGHTLDEIVVNESRIQLPFKKQNRNIQVLDRAMINGMAVKSINELLTYAGGVDVRQRGPWGTQTDIGIDGGTFDQTLVLVNGVKMNDPQTGHLTMNLPVPLEEIERIEILKGAAARIYGVNALNGAINIVTRRPEQTGLYANAYTGSNFKRDTSNQNPFGGSGVQMGGSLVGKRMKHSLALANESSSGYRYNTSFNNTKAYYQSSLKLSERNSIDFMSGFINNDFGASMFYAPPRDNESKEAVRTFIGSIGGTLQVSDNWVMKPRLSYRANKDDYIFIRQKPDAFHNIHTTGVIDAELNNTLLTTYGVVGAGLELRTERINSNNLGIHDRTNMGVSAEYSFTGIPSLLINAGAYLNYNSDYGWDIFPGIDAGWQIINQLRIFANIGTGQRLPTFTDLYYTGPTNIGNDQLRPERSLSTEAGLKWSSGRLYASLSGFYRHTSSFIDWIKYRVEAPWEPMNSSQVNTRGVSISADYRLSEVTGASQWGIINRASYTWLSPEVSMENAENAISNYAINSLRHQITNTIIINYHNLLSMSLGMRYAERINSASSGYLLIDNRLSVTPGSVTVYFDANNITNKEYVEAGASPMPGRWFTLGIKWKWANL
ncbi:iron complex outermembrane receptor protein [Arcticibacter tournemirensis]|uniref:TonB-dependent receptor n=1 Tax=Arcticibacter tournemirensis TaxID=699437 RepID=A0A5M9H956_9SPHI|nr:TonB-dependent receptor [Arcticibacter tournemirensis]KAA8482889.1 TonB-dependent receptor [Arcticibacter tournemirensis]TQM49730.1 iron complex outermembrane receptor protein [Arcticibacter tournemirensis]